VNISYLAPHLRESVERHLRPLPPAGVHHPAQDILPTGLERERLQQGAHRQHRRDRLSEDCEGEVQGRQRASRNFLRRPPRIADVNRRRLGK